MGPPIYKTFAAFLAMLGTLCPLAQAGGPRWVAGTAYFNPSVKGQPVVWAGGAVIYYTDQGALSSYLSNSAAANLVALAALPWTQVSTAAVTITAGGTLSEDVSGANVGGSRGNVVWPADVESIARPVAIVYDADGSVLNTVLGAGASDPAGCLTNAVTSFVDGVSAQAKITHAIVILNGLCATDASQVTNMQYLLEREFGRVLGLDWSQANDNVWTGTPQPTAADYQGWPLMHPVNLNCGSDSYSCVPTPTTLRMDDRAALGRLYPTATFSQTTLRLHGTISFAGGQGMQGVVVKATRLITGTTMPDTSMVASCVSGFLFRGNVGNVVTGTLDSSGNAMARFGSDVSAVEGEYDLAGLEVAAGKRSIDYQITFEAVNPLYTGGYSVGPDVAGTPAPSGTLATIVVRNLQAGANVEEDVAVPGSATGGSGMIGSFANPATLPASGIWQSWLNGYGHIDWFDFLARPNRLFSVITVAQNEAAIPSQLKAMPLLGAWFGDDPAGVPPDFATSEPFDSSSEGTTILQIQTPTGDGAISYSIVAAVADARGDGRPDYAYSGRVLYADSLNPLVVPGAGGVIAVTGAGFAAGERVLVNAAPAIVLAVQPGLLIAQAPPLAANPAQAVDVELDDPTGARAVMFSALVYGSSASSGDTLNLVSVPGGSGVASGAVAAVAPGSFTVQAVDSNGSPAPGATVTFTSANGAALSACGRASSCSVNASSAGLASTMMTPAQAGADILTASLPDGATVEAPWVATTAPGTALQFAVNPLLVETGVAMAWPVSVTVVSGGVPASGLTVTWSLLQNGKVLSSTTSVTNGQGVASYAAALPALVVGGLVSVEACVAGTTCATVNATGVQPGFTVALRVAGTFQSVAENSVFAPLQLEITDGSFSGGGSAGNPLAGASVTFTQTLFSYVAGTEPGKQPPARLLDTSTVIALSDWNGTVTLQPLQQPGVAGFVVLTARVGGHLMGTFKLDIVPGTAPTNGGPVAPRKRIQCQGGCRLHL